MRILLAMFVAGVVTGCATNSGVLPASDGNYTVMHQGGGALIQTAELKTRATNEASAFCQGKGKTLKVLYTKEIQAAPFGRWPEAELLFTCQ
jgi:hypothetical protein